MLSPVDQSLQTNTKFDLYMMKGILVLLSEWMVLWLLLKVVELVLVALTTVVVAIAQWILVGTTSMMEILVAMQLHDGGGSADGTGGKENRAQSTELFYYSDAIQNKHSKQ